jgi:hypothetical protein
VILHTTTGGQNWYLQPSPLGDVTLTGVYFIDANTGYISGGEGSILKTTSGGDPIGITPISGNVPGQYELYQNYPNPFNPTTVISYQLAVNSYVKLKIHDVLGREVAMLVNQDLKAGTYEVTWDASGYPGGVYYYRLLANEFAETKKMVLVK